LKGGCEEMKRTLGRFFPGAILLALVSILSPTNAYASVIAKASNSSAQSIKTVTFQVAPELTTTGSATTFTPFSSTSNGVSHDAYFVNFGTVDVKAFTWTFNQTAGTSPATLYACPINIIFKPSVLQCSDSSTPTTIATTSVGPAVLTGTGPALKIGEYYPIRLLINKKNDTFTVSSTVSGSQIRNATNTVA